MNRLLPSSGSVRVLRRNYEMVYYSQHPWLSAELMEVPSQLWQHPTVPFGHMLEARTLVRRSSVVAFGSLRLSFVLKVQFYGRRLVFMHTK